MTKPNLLSDTVFKAVFASPDSGPILTNFLNAVLSNSPHAPFSQVMAVNPFNPATYLAEKTSILDLRARDSRGRLINIEVQLRGQVAFRERVLYYWAKTFSSQLDSPSGYQDLAPTIAVCLLGPQYPPFPNRPRLHRVFQILETQNPAPGESPELFSPHLEIHWIETSALKDWTEQDILNHRDLSWLYHLVHSGDSPEQPVMEDIVHTYDEIKEAYLKYNQVLSDEQIRFILELEVEADRAYRSELRWEQEKAIAEGQRDALVATARNLLAQGIDVQVIARATGLDNAEILSLQ